MRINKKGSIIALLLVVCLLAFGSLATAKAPVLRMATTTSTDNTGLLDYLAPILLKDTGIEIQWVSVGTGKALEYGRNGDVDVVLTHAPSQEDKFMAEGAGVNRRKVMYNDFVLIGPANDPAGIKGKPVVEALATIAAKGQPLVSRADKSGTHTAELKLLKAAGVKDFDKAKWYVQTGQGMLKTINIADEHIFQDNMNRINLGLRDQALRFNFDNLQDIARCRQMFEGALKASLELSKRNYKLVAPQFWPATGKIQFLMPIYLEGVQAIQEGESKEVLPPTVALSMEMVHGQYIGTTILTLDMAYQNARLIARPDGFWLDATKIFATSKNEG